MAHSDLHAVDRGWRRVGPCGGLLGIQHVPAQPTRDGLAQGRVGGYGSRDQTRKGTIKRTVRRQIESVTTQKAVTTERASPGSAGGSQSVGTRRAPDSDRILQGLTTAVVVLDSALKVLDLNTAAENLLGGSRRQAVDRPIRDFFTPPDELVALCRRADSACPRSAAPAAAGLLLRRGRFWAGVRCAPRTRREVRLRCFCRRRQRGLALPTEAQVKEILCLQLFIS